MVDLLNLQVGPCAPVQARRFPEALTTLQIHTCNRRGQNFSHSAHARGGESWRDGQVALQMEGHRDDQLVAAHLLRATCILDADFDAGRVLSHGYDPGSVPYGGT